MKKPKHNEIRRIKRHARKAYWQGQGRFPLLRAYDVEASDFDGCTAYTLGVGYGVLYLEYAPSKESREIQSLRGSWVPYRGRVS